MAEFEVNTGKIRGTACEIRCMAASIENLSNQVRQIARNLQLGEFWDARIKGQLHRMADSIDEQARHTARCGTALADISTKYQSSEQAIADGKKKEFLLYFDDYLGRLYRQYPRMKKEGAEQKETSVSWLSGKYAGSGKVLGADSQGEVSGELFGASHTTKWSTGAKWKEKNGKMALDSLALLTAKIAGEAHVAKGSAKGNIGYLFGKAEGTVGKFAAEGSVSASLIKDGKFSPQISAKGELSAVGVEGSAEGGFGTENNNVHVDANGKVGVAKVSGEVAAGTVYVKNADGTESKRYGVKGEVGAEAYVAEGKISGGITILGVKIDAGIGGKFGGAGAKAGGSVTNGGVSGSASLGFGAGLEVDFSVDWSGFKWKW